jgi:hypothetical protein
MSNKAGPQASIGNGQTLNADAAVYWHLLVAAVAAACGVWVVATEGTRTYARQLYLWQNRNRPGFNPAWHPDDSRANHVAGRCVDVGSQVGYVLTLVSIAFYRLAGSYGFRATIPGEPWHFEWRLEWVAPHIRFIAAVQAASPQKEIDPMPTADEVVKTLLNYPAYSPAPGETAPTVSQVLKSIDQGLWKGGDSTGPDKLPLATQIANIHEAVTETITRDSGATGTVVGPKPVKLTQIQDAADTNTLVRRVLAAVDQLVPPVKK